MSRGNTIYSNKYKKFIRTAITNSPKQPSDHSELSDTPDATCWSPGDMARAVSGDLAEMDENPKEADWDYSVKCHKNKGKRRITEF